MQAKALSLPLQTNMTVSRHILQEEKEKVLFCDYVDGYLLKCHKEPKTRVAYEGTIKHFKKFCEVNRISPVVRDLGLDLTEEFVYYLYSLDLMASTVCGHLVRLKTLIRSAAMRGYDVDFTFSDVKVKDDEKEVVYLEFHEIALVYSCPGLTEPQKRIRDLFILECMTGLRYSDASRLKEENFIDGKIYIKTKKTGTPVVIPQAKYVREILKKYNYKCPSNVSLQHFNTVIKEICQLAGINQIISYERTIGGKPVCKYVEKCERISSHTGRRSAATNMFINGIPTIRIMQITGHKTEAAFMRYIGMSREENAAILASNIFFR